MIKININILIYKILLNRIGIIFKYEGEKKIIIFNLITYIYVFCYFKNFKNIILINLYYFHIYH